MDRLIMAAFVYVIGFGLFSVGVYFACRWHYGDRWGRRDALLFVAVWFTACVLANLVGFSIGLAIP